MAATQRIFSRTKRIVHTAGRHFSQISGINDVVIVSSVRTPFGSSYVGGLAGEPAPILGAACVKEAVKRAGIPKESIEEVFMGNTIAAGLKQLPARQSVIYAGLPSSTEASTVNKACASSMKCMMFAAQAIMLGHKEVMVAGGFENMSKPPYFIFRDQLKFGDTTTHDGVFHDGLQDAFMNIHMAMCAENTNKKMGITREEQDAYALSSYERSAAAWDSGVYDNEVMAYEIKGKHGTVIVKEDEEFRKVKKDKISKLKPAFDKNGSITAANASTISDGAAAAVIMSAKAAERMGVKPLARIITFADAAMDPIDFPLAPAQAIPKLFEQSGLRPQDVAMWEINEAFSSVVIANMRLLDLDHAKVNIHGGAVSIGHPVGASGVRIVGHLAHSLKPGEIGVAGICNGGGAASAMMIEKL